MARRQDVHPVHGVPIRRFEPGATVVLLRNALEPAGHKVDYMPGRNSLKPWCLDGKQVRFEDVVLLADKLRIKNGLMPIDVECPVRP